MRPCSELGLSLASESLAAAAGTGGSVGNAVRAVQPACSCVSAAASAIGEYINCFLEFVPNTYVCSFHEFY